jgi:hypothetical protein
MTELTEFTDTTPDLTDEEKRLLKRAGASDALIEVCDADVDVERHSALQETKKYLREWESLTDENAEEFSPLGGHFYQALWDGDIYAAYSRADGTNRPIILEVFGVRKINRNRPRHASKVTV